MYFKMLFFLYASLIVCLFACLYYFCSALYCCCVFVFVCLHCLCVRLFFKTVFIDTQNMYNFVVTCNSLLKLKLTHRNGQLGNFSDNLYISRLMILLGCKLTFHIGCLEQSLHYILVILYLIK